VVRLLHLTDSGDGPLVRLYGDRHDIRHIIVGWDETHIKTLIGKTREAFKGIKCVIHGTEHDGLLCARQWNVGFIITKAAWSVFAYWPSDPWERHSTHLVTNLDNTRHLRLRTKIPQKLTKLFLHFYSTKYHTQQPLYNTLELLMMGIVMPETCWASNKICNKNLCCI